MKEIDFQKLEQLVVERKEDEVKGLISEALNSELTPEEQGELYVNLAMVYMKVSTQLNQEYLQYLKDAMAQIKEIDTIKNDNLKKFDIQNVRNQIKDL